MFRDMKSHLDVAPSLAPATRATGTATGDAVDLQNYTGAMAVFRTGAWTDGTHTPALFESADGTTYAAVAAADLGGTFTAVSGTAGQNGVQRVDYRGGKRYVKGMLVSGTSTTGLLSGLDIVRGNPVNGPLA